MVTPDRPAAVIVHYGYHDRTIKLANALIDFDADVVVVANDLVARPGCLDRRVEWIIPERNLGFGDAFNLAIVGRNNSAYVLLNSDLTISRLTFERCLSVLGQDGIGVVGPVLRHEDGTLQSGAARLSRWRRMPRTLFDPGSQVVDCVWVTGAAMFMRREVAAEVGMDGSYFLIAEDADLCVRAARAGWRVVCCGDAEATHLGGQTITGPRGYYYSTRNCVWWTRSNFGLGVATLNWFALVLNLPRILLADMLKRHDFMSSRLTVLGLHHAWRRKPERDSGSLADEPLAGRIMHW